MADVLSSKNLWELKLTIDGDRIVDADGCSHEGLEDALHSGVLGFCGCGDPLKNLKFIGRVLRLIFDHWEWSHSTKEEIKYGPGSRWQAYRDAREAMCGGSDQEMFVLYALDKAELIEHGGSVGGSWMTSKGCAMMELIDQLEEDDEEECPAARP